MRQVVTDGNPLRSDFGTDRVRQYPAARDDDPGEALARGARGEVAGAVGGRRHLPLRPHEDPRRGLLHRHAAAHGERRAAPRARVQLHAHRPHRPLPAHARQGGLLPDGLGRQRPQRRAPRPARHRARSSTPPFPTTPTSAAREGRPEGPRRSRSAGPTSSSCARRSSRSSRRSTTSSGRPSGCRSTGTTPTRSIGPKAARTSPARVPAPRGARPRLPQRVADAVGRRHAHVGGPGRARRTARSPGAYHKLVFSGPDGPLLIDTTRPELLPPCVAVVAHPDDERYQPLFGQTATTPLFGAPSRSSPTRLADPEKGTGVAMICTFGDTTDVTWWRELSLPVRAIVQRDGRLRPITWGEPGLGVDRPRRRAGRLRRAGRQDRQAGPGPHRRAARRRRAHRGRDPPHHPPGEVLGERRPGRWRSSPASSGSSATRPKDELLARGKELAWWPDFMRVRYENWVNGLIGDWNITRQRFFGVPFPVWYPIDADGVDRLPVADPRRRGRRCRSTPPPRCRRATTSRSATSPAASPPTPT